MMNRNVLKAFGFARKKHAGQRRRFNEDQEFFEHPKRIAESFEDNCVQEQVVAYLHDVVEDTDTTLGNLLDEGFSLETVQSVEAITKQDNEDYLFYIIRCSQNEIARKVKIRDIKDNLSDLPRHFKDKREKYRMAIFILKLPSSMRKLKWVPVFKNILHSQDNCL